MRTMSTDSYLSYTYDRTGSREYDEPEWADAQDEAQVMCIEAGSTVASVARALGLDDPGQHAQSTRSLLNALEADGATPEEWLLNWTDKARAVLATTLERICSVTNQELMVSAWMSGGTE